MTLFQEQLAWARRLQATRKLYTRIDTWSFRTLLGASVLFAILGTHRLFRGQDISWFLWGMIVVSVTFTFRTTLIAKLKNHLLLKVGDIPEAK